MSHHQAECSKKVGYNSGAIYTGRKGFSGKEFLGISGTKSCFSGEIFRYYGALTIIGLTGLTAPDSSYPV